LLQEGPRAIRRLYAAALPAVARCPLEIEAERDLTVYTFSSLTHLPEQVASLRSLLRNYGLPRRITVVSDGSHGRDEVELLERIHERISVVHHRDLLRDDLPQFVARYADDSPMGVKLALELSFPVNGPTMYADADVLFFAGITALSDDAERAGGRPRYLEDFDCRFLDERLLIDRAETERPANAGALLLFERLAWDSALERLEALDGDPSFLTEQTVVHLALRDSGGSPLPPDRYVLRVDDEDDWRDRYGGPAIALRHYCFSEVIQRKLWLNVHDDLLALVRHEPRAAAAAGLDTVREWRAHRRRSGRAAS
jgi:hypothetical protein